MFSEIDKYSLMDFEQVKQGELASRLQTLLALGNEHTSQCDVSEFLEEIDVEHQCNLIKVQ